MFNCKWCAAVLLLLAGISSASAAVRLKDLYEAGVGVTSQDKAERAQALQEALREVFVRVSGTHNFDQVPALQKALNDAAQYAQQYRYRQNPHPSASGPNGNGTPPLTLWVRFAGRAVERLLHDNGLPVWSRERPVTLVWLAVDEGQNRHIVAGDSDDDLRGELEGEAHRRGLPLLFPIMDLADQRHLSFADLWGGFADTIQAASKRYSPEAVLVGRLYRTPDGSWNARWSLYNQQQESHWASNGRDRQTVLAFGVDGAADALASRYAMRAGEHKNTQVSLIVDGVQGLQDYARVSHYLSSFAFVTDVNVDRVDQSQVAYSLNIQGDPSGLVQAFALGNVLEPAKPAPGTAISKPSDGSAAAVAAAQPDSSVLTYRLMP